MSVLHVLTPDRTNAAHTRPGIHNASSLLSPSLFDYPSLLALPPLQVLDLGELEIRRVGR